MAKKKKTQLKSVARGFATVSVPKKVAPTEPEEEGTILNPTTHGIEANEEKRLGQDNFVGQNAVSTKDLDLVKVGDQFLQALVDRLQEKTEKEIVR